MTIHNGFIISLSPTHLSAIAVRRGRVLQTETTSLDPSNWKTLWSDGLMHLDQPLRQLLSRFSFSTRHGAVLLYHSPTLTSQINSTEQGGAYAREATRSKIRETVGVDAAVSVCELGHAGNDGVGNLLFAYSDRDDTLRAFYAWLTRCGVRVTGMIPSSVVSVIAASEQAIAEPGDTAVFYLDKHCSVISHATESGELKLVRPADFGYESLVDSYRQAISEQLKEDSLSNTSVDSQAQSYLFEHGIPFQVKQAGDLELRSSVLPRMAPALQRIGIDLKQTIRFGIDKTSELSKLTVVGPGAAIPSITKAIGEHVDLHVVCASGTDQYDPSNAGSVGSTELALLKLSKGIPMLLPRLAEETLFQGELKKALAAGVAFAGLVMGGQYMLAQKQINEIQTQMNRDVVRYEQVIAFEETAKEVEQAQKILSTISKMVTSHTKDRANWEHLLAQLSSLTGEGVRIQEVRGEFDGDQPELRMNGYSVTLGDKNPGQVLEHFVNELNTLEKVQSVKLGATSRISLGVPNSDENLDDWGVQFVLSVELDSRVSPYVSLAQFNTEPADWIQP